MSIIRKKTNTIIMNPTNDTSNLIPPVQEMQAGIDAEGKIKEFFHKPKQSPGGIFLICKEGNCKVSIYLNQYTMEKNSIAIIMPDIFFQIIEQSEDCKFEYIAFSKSLIQGTKLFTHTIEFAPFILEQPVVTLKQEFSDFLHIYIETQIQALRVENLANTSYIGLAYSQLIISLGNIYKQVASKTTTQYNRNQEIVRELVRVIVQHYRQERNVTFYADALHLSPQHLSTTIKKVTGKTLTDIISSFIIHDAEAKLKSTGMTIQEIAYSLNFPDISFFGKYFKRYTGMSPKQYRNS